MTKMTTNLVAVGILNFCFRNLGNISIHVETLSGHMWAILSVARPQGPAQVEPHPLLRGHSR